MVKLANYGWDHWWFSGSYQALRSYGRRFEPGQAAMDFFIETFIYALPVLSTMKENIDWHVVKSKKF